jgi:hypothetical protein
VAPQLRATVGLMNALDRTIAPTVQASMRRAAVAFVSLAVSF